MENNDNFKAQEETVKKHCYCRLCGAENSITSNFCHKCGKPLKQTPKKQAPMAPETDDMYKSEFTGGALKEFFINVGVLLASVCTLFIAYPFLVCLKEKWKASHTYVNGRRLEFDGNGAQLIGKYMLWLLYSIITFGIYALLVLPLNMQRWRTKHTHVEGYRINGEKGESKFNGKMFGLFGIRIISYIMIIPSVFTLGFAGCWAKLLKLRWMNEHKKIDGVQIRCEATTGAFWRKKVVWIILSIVTCGIYLLFIGNKVNKWISQYNKFSTPAVFPRPQKTIEELENNKFAEDDAKYADKGGKFSYQVKRNLAVTTPILYIFALVLDIIFIVEKIKYQSVQSSLIIVIIMAILTISVLCSGFELSLKKAKERRESGYEKTRKLYMICTYPVILFVVIIPLLVIIF